MNDHKERNKRDEKSQIIRPKSSIISFFKSFGPGVITGGADDDPSGIATYSQAGSQFGLGMLWLAIFQFPLMTVIQEICGRIGLVTGSGLASAIKKRYSMRIALPITSLLLIANTINIGADIGAMAASIKLVFSQLSFILATLLFTSIIILLEILIPYNKYAKILKYLCLSLFAYLATAIIVGGNWNQILVASIIPHIESTPSFVMMIVAMYGTTISPYLFFWQASEEAEEDVAKNKIKEIGKGKPKITTKEVKIMRVDTIIGMAFSQLITWSIIVTTAGSLHVNGALLHN